MNIVIVGAGPAGESAAVTARKKNSSAAITVIEKEQVGGLCLNKGCIPSKTLLEHVHAATLTQQPIEWENLQTLKTNVIQGLRSQIETKFKTLKINLIPGEARFESATSVTVQSANGTKNIFFDKAIIATGTEILYPPPLDQIKNQILNSDTILNLAETPRSILVVGGGAIGCEFACLLNAAGSTVTLVELKEGLLPGEDTAITAALASSYEKRGIHIKTANKVSEAKKMSGGWSVTLSGGETLEVEQILACVGRVPNPATLSLEKAGIKIENNRIAVDSHQQTSNPNIFAAGDVAGSRLAHHASELGRVAALNALGESEIYDDRFVPRCLYSWPEVASVGAWKYQLDEKNTPCKTVRAYFQANAKALAAGESEGMVQIVFDPESGKILGAQIIGSHATELIHVFSVALKAQLTLNDLKDITFAHPSLSESIKDAAKK